MAQERECARFAPSTTGRAHPGTLLAALLAWLDARSRGARLVLRLEDLDPQRCRAEHATAMVSDLAWFGLDYDQVVLQSDLAAQHHAALDRLQQLDLLYPSPRSRRQRLEGPGLVAPADPDDPSAGAEEPMMDPGEPSTLPPGGWRAARDPLRVRIEPGRYSPQDAGGLNLEQLLARRDDPVVRRRDGAVAYQLAVVVDDAASGVTRVVRGADIAPSSALQMALRRALGLPEVVYRHHLLLLEERGRKFAKLHGSVSLPQLRSHYDASRLCGFLAACAGLCAPGTRCMPRDLITGFTWRQVSTLDVLVRFDGRELTQAGAVAP
jgi:glutamyl/glutaminyl-tRNA synthetase